MNRLHRLLTFYFNGVFVRFLLAGGLAAALNFASRIALQPLVGFVSAVVLAFGVGLVSGFLLNRAFVFPNSGKPMREEVGWFFFFNALAFPVTLGGSIVLRAYVFGRFLPMALAESAAHGVSILLPVIFNFAAHRLVTFATKPAKAA